MTNNELLLAISNLLDEKLEQKLNQRFEEFERKMDQKLDQKLNQRFEEFERKMDQKLDQKLEQKLEQKLAPINETIKLILLRLDKLEARVDRIESLIENNILPRLQNIEQCYISTYERYKVSVTKLDNIESDVSLLKKVVCDHSQKINVFA